MLTLSSIVTGLTEQQMDRVLVLDDRAGCYCDTKSHKKSSKKHSSKSQKKSSKKFSSKKFC